MRHGVPNDVTQSPGGLVAHVRVGRGEEAHEKGNSAVVDDGLGLQSCAARDVGQRPCRFVLELCVVVSVEELDEPRHHATIVDDGLDGWVLFDHQELSDAHHPPELRRRVL